MTRPIVVVGSINMDLVLRAPRIPAAGETLIGSEFAMHPGGKGANQAVGVARLGCPVQMIGMVGRDDFGRTLHAQLETEGVDTEHVGSVDDATGVATITVDDRGENSIIVVPGANQAVTTDLLLSKEEVLRSAGMILAQLEIPMESIICLARLCAEHKIPLILDPAPAQTLSREVLEATQWISPNESEAAVLTNGCTSPEEQVKALRAAGAQGIILKRGAAGICYASGSNDLHLVPAPKVSVRDTTAAGDAFNAAFAVGLMRDYSLDQSVRSAVAASALSVTRDGAQASLAKASEMSETMNS